MSKCINVSWNVCLTCAKNRRLSGCSSDLDDGGGVCRCSGFGGRAESGGKNVIHLDAMFVVVRKRRALGKCFLKTHAWKRN